LYAGGQFFDQQPGTVAQWNGSRWTELPGDVAEPQSFACANHALYAGGLAIAPNNYNVRGVTKWDGHSWSWLGSGTDGMVLDLSFMTTNPPAGSSRSPAAGSHRPVGSGWEHRASRVAQHSGGIPNPFTVSTSIAYRLTSPVMCGGACLT
jgi:hypothetical protein